MSMMAFVFLSVVRNDVNGGMGRGRKAWLEVCIKRRVLGTEEMKETLILTLSTQGGNVSEWQFLDALMERVQLANEQGRISKMVWVHSLWRRELGRSI